VRKPGSGPFHTTPPETNGPYKDRGRFTRDECNGAYLMTTWRPITCLQNSLRSTCSPTVGLSPSRGSVCSSSAWTLAASFAAWLRPKCWLTSCAAGCNMVRRHSLDICSSPLNLRSAQEHTAWSFVFAVIGALTVFLKVYSFFAMFLQTFVISGKSVRVFNYRKGSEFDTRFRSTAEEMGGASWRICG